MPRIRYIKPDFFTDEDLGKLDPLCRLAFTGLWCYADREGRLKDRPVKLKVEILPYDECDFNAILDTLSQPKPINNKRCFITRYEISGEKYIQINNFSKHQKPHHAEMPSDIPDPAGFIIENPAYPSDKVRKQVYERDNYTCLYCGLDLKEEPRKICLDHIIPMAKEGSNGINNLATSCKKCNALKLDKMPEEAGLIIPEGLGESISRRRITPRQRRVNHPSTVANTGIGIGMGNGDGKGNGEGKGDIPYTEIIADLNQKSDKNYRTTKTTKDLIKARWFDGASLEDFLKVHTNMTMKWKEDPKMNQYLRPATLYCASKFEGYLNSKVSLSEQGRISPVLDKSQGAFKRFLENGGEHAE